MHLESPIAMNRCRTTRPWQLLWKKAYSGGLLIISKILFFEIIIAAESMAACIVLEQLLRVTFGFTGPERGVGLELALDFETSKSTLSDIFPPTRPTPPKLCNPSKWFHSLVIKYSNIWSYGDHYHSNHQKSIYFLRNNFKSWLWLYILTALGGTGTRGQQFTASLS